MMQAGDSLAARLFAVPDRPRAWQLPFLRLLIGMFAGLCAGAASAEGAATTSPAEEGGIAVLRFIDSRAEGPRAGPDGIIRRYVRLEWEVGAWLRPPAQATQPDVKSAYSSVPARTSYPQVEFAGLKDVAVLGEVVPVSRGLVCTRHWPIAGLARASDEFIARERDGVADVILVRRWAEPKRASEEFARVIRQTPAVSAVLVLEAESLLAGLKEDAVRERVLDGLVQVFARADAPTYVKEMALRYMTTFAGDDSVVARMRITLWHALVPAIVEEMRRDSPDLVFVVDMMQRLQRDPGGAIALQADERKEWVAAMRSCVEKAAKNATLAGPYVGELADRLARAADKRDSAGSQEEPR